MRIEFGELMPDQQDLDSGGLEDAINVIPYASAYGPFPDAAVFSSSLTGSGTCVGAVSTSALDGTVYTFLGTDKKLYKTSATGFLDVSRTATYNVAADGRWRFATFGNTQLAVNGIDPLQVYTLGTSTRYLDASASASAPVSTFIDVVRDFVFLGVASPANRVQWSQINNALRYTTSVRFQADFQDLPGSGPIRGLTGGDFATILTERSVWRATYQGSPLIFRFDEVAPGIGCLIPGSVARFQNMTFFYSSSGFYAFNGDQCVPIGSERIDQFFREDLNASALYRVWATIDPKNKLYIVLYPSVAGGTTPNRLLIFNWEVNRWARGTQTAELIFNGATAGFTLEGLDAISSSIDALPFSLDSDVWRGGLTILSGVDTGHRIITFDSGSKDATFITGEAQVVEDGRAFVRAVRPLVQGDSNTTITAQIGGRHRPVDDVTWGTASSMNADGFCPQRNNARYQRVRMDISGGFTRAKGFDFDFTPDGQR